MERILSVIEDVTESIHVAIIHISVGVEGKIKCGM
jgi:hypothetical protein